VDDIEVPADTAHGTGKKLARLGAAGHTPVIKPWPTRPAAEGGFVLDDFAYDDAGTPTCSGGGQSSLRPAASMPHKRGESPRKCGGSIGSRLG